MSKARVFSWVGETCKANFNVYFGFLTSGHGTLANGSGVRGGFKPNAAPRQLPDAALITLRYLETLQGRTAKPHRDFIGAVLCASVAYLIGVTHVATSDTDEVLIGPVVGYRRNHYPITVDVDIGPIRPAPDEIHRLPPLHSAP
jgi:hypothetical protein